MLGRPLISIIAGGNTGTTAAMTPLPDIAVCERGASDQPLQRGPAVKLLERGDRAIPRNGGYPEVGIGAPARTMESGDIRMIGRPDSFATYLG
jgi:hypothetical protein